MVKVLEKLKELFKTKGVKRERSKFQKEAKKESKPEEKQEQQK